MSASIGLNNSQPMVLAAAIGMHRYMYFFGVSLIHARCGEQGLIASCTLICAPGIRQARIVLGGSTRGAGVDMVFSGAIINCRFCWSGWLSVNDGRGGVDHRDIAEPYGPLPLVPTQRHNAFVSDQCCCARSHSFPTRAVAVIAPFECLMTMMGSRI